MDILTMVRKKLAAAEPDYMDEPQFGELDWEVGAPPQLYEVTRPYAEHPKITFCQPRSMEDMSYIAEQLRDADAVLLNLECLKRNQAYRMMDIVSGIAYGMNYEIVPVASHCCLILSRNAELIGSRTRPQKFR